MTLLIAAVEINNIWMVADTAISGGNLDLRDREQQLKIIPSRDTRALIGFSGEPVNGARLIEQAASILAGPDAVNFLLGNHRENPSVDFAYAYMDLVASPHLVRISQGEAQDVLALHLGLTDAFEHFQRIRHNTEINPVPEAVSIFFTGSRATDPMPNGLNSAITSMLRLFVERSEREMLGAGRLPTI
jgi:hypothetical protein